MGSGIWNRVLIPDNKISFVLFKWLERKNVTLRQQRLDGDRQTNLKRAAVDWTWKSDVFFLKLVAYTKLKT